MKQKILVLNSCVLCPNRAGPFGGYYCFLDKQLRFLLKGLDFPDWCPLQDAPERKRRIPDAPRFPSLPPNPMLHVGTITKSIKELTKKDLNRARVPNYPEDLNACHEMEKNPKLHWGNYIDCINKKTRPYDSPAIERAMLQATARQRCEAFVEVMSK